MKVLLISANTATSPYPVYPLGMSVIAAALEQAGHEVRQFDMLAAGESLDALSECLRATQPELVGISIRNVDNVNFVSQKRYVDSVEDIVRRIREATRAKVVLGGSGYSMLPGEILKAVGADYGIVGEGERLVVDLAARLARGEEPPEKILHAPPSLAGREVPGASYDGPILRYYLGDGSVAPVQTKRGCAHRCVYCSYPVLEGTGIRTREAAAVVDDIERLMRDHHAKQVFFTDSVFNDNENRFREIIAEMRRRKVSVPWTAFFKPTDLDDAIIEEMKETGLFAAELGSDAPTDVTLQGLGKDFAWKDVVECNELFIRHDVPAAHYFMFGCPGETRETALEGIANVKSLRKTVVFIFLGVRILPNTLLERIALRDGVITEGQDLLKSVYYISPKVDREWLEAELTKAFSGNRSTVFPADIFDAGLRMMHKMGQSGALWNLLIKPERTTARRRVRHGAE